jgi:hypothetical protein
MTDNVETVEYNLVEVLTSKLPDLSGPQVEQVRDVIVEEIRELVNYHMDNQRKLKEPKDTAALFNGFLNGNIPEIQNFDKGVVGRRLFTKPVEGLERTHYQPYVRNKDGREEEWNITLDNLNKGRWAEVPSAEDRVSFGIAMDMLFKGEADFIRCEDWVDHRQCLRREIVIHEDGNYFVLRNTANNALFVPCGSSMSSNNWIMFKLSKVTQ